MPAAWAPMQSNAWLATCRMRGSSVPRISAAVAVRRRVRLEVAGRGDREVVVERKADVGPRVLEHVRVAVRQDREPVPRSEALERRDHVVERAEPLDLGDQPAHLVLRVRDAGPLEGEGEGAPADLPVGRVAPIDERVDHRVLEVRAPPPGDEGARPAAPPLGLEVRRDGLGEAGLHVDDRAVEIEGQDPDGVLDLVGTGRSPWHRHGVPSCVDARVGESASAGIRGLTGRDPGTA